MERWKVEIAAGSLAGMANQIVCHPFDVVRTRLQTIPTLKGPLECGRSILAQETIFGFYKGLSAPMFAQALYKSILFSVNGAMTKILAAQNQDSRLSLSQVFLCGSLSGLVNSFVVTPVELVRNQLIMQIRNSERRYAGPASVVRHVWINSGGTASRFLGSLYRGWGFTALRDTTGVGLWFLGFRVTCDLWRDYLHLGQHESLGLLHLLLSGSVSGVLFWSVALPWDGLKTRVQSASLDAPSPRLFFSTTNTTKLGTFLPCHDLDLHQLYRGWQVALGRGVPGAAITLTTHAIIADFLSTPRQ